jgi:hypothetical protein
MTQSGYVPTIGNYTKTSHATLDQEIILGKAPKLPLQFLPEVVNLLGIAKTPEGGGAN